MEPRKFQACDIYQDFTKGSYRVYITVTTQVILMGIFTYSTFYIREEGLLTIQGVIYLLLGVIMQFVIHGFNPVSQDHLWNDIIEASTIKHCGKSKLCNVTQSNLIWRYASSFIVNQLGRQLILSLLPIHMATSKSLFQFILTAVATHLIINLSTIHHGPEFELIKREDDMCNSVCHLFRNASDVLQKDADIVKLVVQQDGLALEYVPLEFKANREIVRLAIKQNRLALEYASKEIKKDKEFMAMIPGQNSSLWLKFNSIMQSGRLQNILTHFVRVVVQLDGCALAFVHLRFKRNQEIVKVATQQNGLALEYAVEELQQDKEIAKLAIQQNGLALEHTVEELKKDREIAKLAVQQNGLALEYVAKTLKENEEIVKLAVQQNGLALEYAAEELKGNKVIVNSAIHQNGLSLQYAAREMIEDKEIVQLALLKNAKAFEFASNCFRADNQLIFEALKHEPSTLLYHWTNLTRSRGIHGCHDYLSQGFTIAISILNATPQQYYY